MTVAPVVMDKPVAGLHAYVFAPLAVKVTLPPLQKFVGPLAEMVMVGRGLTVIFIAVDVLVHPPDVTVLLYQVVCVNGPGVYPIALFVPDAEPKPATALVVLLSHKYM